ncbi:unnamed protein product [Allacma fusca]|uniref:Uncharacterized protein n=1 Tax=Allacma fusca TaxID=39272 RepID=A0A8J2K630_9HEXA|nr:unnamed protein product [Allacma fusca]
MLMHAAMKNEELEQAGIELTRKYSHWGRDFELRCCGTTRHFPLLRPGVNKWIESGIFVSQVFALNEIRKEV